MSPSRKIVATGQQGSFPKIFLWNPRLGQKDIPADMCLEADPPGRMMERKVPR